MPDTAQTALSPAEIAALIERTHLGRGSHKDFNDGVCAMELVAHIAGEPFSDAPKCVCPVLGAFVRAWNDGLPDNERDAILKPLLPQLIGTRGSAAVAERRALMAADWLVRTHTVAWLRLAKLNAQADTLAALPEITSMAQPAAWAAAWAAGDAAWAAAWAAAGAAAWAAIKDTKQTLQRSAADLVQRMIAAKDGEI